MSDIFPCFWPTHQPPSYFVLIWQTYLVYDVLFLLRDPPNSIFTSFQRSLTGISSKCNFLRKITFGTKKVIFGSTTDFWAKQRFLQFWPKFAPFGLCFCDSNENHFLPPQARNLAQTNGFIAVLLDHDLEPPRDERTDEHRTDRPRQAPPRAVNSQPVKGPRPPTPIRNPEGNA